MFFHCNIRGIVKRKHYCRNNVYFIHEMVLIVNKRISSADRKKLRLAFNVPPNFTLHVQLLHCLQAARGGINVETERGAARTVSELTLAAVTPNDVGKYSCRPTEGRTDTVVLIVEPG